MSKDEKKAEPMDPSATETDGGLVEHVNEGRTAHALKTLVAEVLALFPETPHQFSERDGRNTALAVTFDVTSLDLDDRDKFASLLSLAKADDRVGEVIVDETGSVHVGLVSNPRTQDSRETFDLGAIWEDMGEEAAEAPPEVKVHEVGGFEVLAPEPMPLYGDVIDTRDLDDQ